jgi:hypothetical protein
VRLLEAQARRLRQRGSINNSNNNSMKEVVLLFCLFFTVKVYSQKKIVIIDSVIFNLPRENWKLKGSLRESGQFMYENKKEKIVISLSAQKKTNYEFYKDNLKDYELVNIFYKWDADYWRTTPDCKINEIKKDSLQKFIIWSIKTPNVLNYNLFGLKKNHLIRINLVKESFIETDAIQFLEQIFLN